jgi:uncharacterized surface protein with fasciclin (FAS1) repeats
MREFYRSAARFWLQIRLPGAGRTDLDFFPGLSVGRTDNAHTARMKNHLDATTRAGEATVLLSAFKSASFIDLLRSPGRCTTNAPSDEAFKRSSSGSFDALFKSARTLKPFMSSQMMRGTAAANDGLAS